MALICAYTSCGSSPPYMLSEMLYEQPFTVLPKPHEDENVRPHVTCHFCLQ